MTADPPPVTPVAGYAGDLTAQQAWQLLAQGRAVLVDVRTEAEWRFVGVPDLRSVGADVALVEWVTGDGNPNSHFVSQVAGVVGGRPAVFLCRSGQRSVSAARAVTQAGAGPAYNVLQGFEGGLDSAGHRGSTGWRADGLPWRQS